MSNVESRLPLEGALVVDLSRMLPGAVLARQLIGLGARLVKVEDPDGGDPMRQVPPLVNGIGVGFGTFLRGAESVTLDLSDEADATQVRGIAARADVLVESFRPGTMERWGLGWDVLSPENPGLVWCSLSSFGGSPALRSRVGHDLTFTAMAGLLDLVGGRVSRLQLADVTSGLLGASSILAALLARERGASGRRVEQPLAAGPLPFLTWRWAEQGAGGEGVLDTLLGGACPCYRVYSCSDGRAVSLAALEPKFWMAFVELIGADGLENAAFALGEDGVRAAAAVEDALSAHPRDHWLRLAEERGLPIGPVHAGEEARLDAAFAAAGLTEQTPLCGGENDTGVGPWNVGVGRTPHRQAPQLGEHTEAILEELAGS